MTNVVLPHTTIGYSPFCVTDNRPPAFEPYTPMLPRIGELQEQIRKLKEQAQDFESDLDKHGQICMKVGIDKGKRIAAQECLEMLNLMDWATSSYEEIFHQAVTAIKEKFGLEKTA